MKVNFNKEMLIKHRFWVLLGFAFLVGLVPLVLLATTVKAAIDQKKDELDKAQKKAQEEAKQLEVRTQKEIDALKEQNEKLSGTKDDVHLKAYLTQQAMHTLPVQMEEQYDFTKGLFAEMIRLNTDKEKDTLGDNGLKNNIVHGVIEDGNVDFILVRDRKGKMWK